MADLPAPLVPAEVDLRDFAFMPLDVARLRDSDLAASETPEACWAAVLLWSASWHQVPAGSMPDDDRWIAKHAGYAQRGKIAKEWAEVRNGALRGWIRCDDGRLYHPVVAEKAIDGWRGKLRQRHAAEMARVKKHNQRHGTSLRCPSFEDWLEKGCPQGHSLYVPEDNTGTEGGQAEDRSGTAENVPRETPSKRQGEGQGQGHIEATLRSASAAPPAPVDGPDGDETGPDKPKARRAAALNSDWQLPPDGRAFAKRRGMSERDIDLEAERFRAYHHGKGTLMKDWAAAWRTWVLSPYRKPASGPMASASRLPLDPSDPIVDMTTGHRRRESDLLKAVEAWKENPRSWKWHELYDEPDKPNCRVPDHVLAAAGLRRAGTPP